MRRQKALTVIYLTIILLGYRAYASNFECPLETDEQSSPIELLQEREAALSAIASDVAMFLEVPYLPNNAEIFLAGTVGALLRVVSAEQKWKERKDSGKKEIVSLVELVHELKDIRKMVTEFRNDISYSNAILHNPNHFIAVIKMYLKDDDSKYNNALDKLISRLIETHGLSKIVFIPRNACHFCLGFGVSTIKYATIIKSPLFFSYSCIQRSWSPKFGVALGYGENGFELTDDFIERNGRSETIFHPEHPFGKDRKKGRVTFNWEGSICFLEGAINHNARFGTGGISPLPLGFSIGPEFTPEVRADEFTIEHDTWKFYQLLGIQQFLSF